MSETTTVTYSIAEVLQRIEDKLDSNHKELSQKIDKQSEKIGTIEVELAEIKAEVRNLKEDVRDIKTVQNTLVTEVSDLKGIKSLIIPIIVAVITAGLTLVARFIPNFPR